MKRKGIGIGSDERSANERKGGESRGKKKNRERKIASRIRIKNYNTHTKPKST